LISLKTDEQIEAMARAGSIIAALYRLIPERVVPGVTTRELDRSPRASSGITTERVPAFKGLYGFPATLCTSVNYEVVHGIPTERRKLAEGDVVSIDCGVKLDGFFSDAAITVPVGEITAEVQRLLDVTREALHAGIEQARPGNRLGDIGAAIQAAADRAEYGIVRDLVGHGIGRSRTRSHRFRTTARGAGGCRWRRGWSSPSSRCSTSARPRSGRSPTGGRW
jgi:methionyl aminopeptidase